MASRSPTVAIVGGGIAGLSLAWALAGRAAVTVFEAGALGERGASGVPAALLNPFRGRTARAHPDDVAGLAAFWRRDDTLRSRGHVTGAQRSGILRIASDERQADLWRAPAADPRVRWLEPGTAPRGVHAPHGALRIDDGGWVRAPELLGALATDARDQGVSIREECRVDDLERTTDGWRLGFADDSLVASYVVLCTGAEPPPGAHRPDAVFERLAGDVVTLAIEKPFEPPIAGGVYGASKSGSAWVGGNHRAPDEHDPGAPRALRDAFSWFVPVLKRADIVDVWTGVRLKRRGNRPLRAELAPGLWFLGAFAGRGFLCCAAEAEELADLIAPSP